MCIGGFTHAMNAPALVAEHRSGTVRLPTLAWVRLALAPVLVFIATSVDRNYQTDFWHHLARGREMAETRRIVNVDLYTFTVPGRPFQDVNWLTQLAYHALYQMGGLPLVQLANSLTLACMMLLLVDLCWRLSRSLLLSAGIGVFTFFGLWQVLLIRPQTISLLLFVVLYGLLHLAHRRRARWLLLLPPALIAVWANVHGAFPLGCYLIGAFLLAQIWERRKLPWNVLLKDRTLRAWAACLLASALATMVNPYGWNIYAYVQGTSATATQRGIEEWLPPGLNVLVGVVWTASLLLTMLVLAKARRHPTALEVCLVVLFLPLACSSTRMVAWWLIASAPVIASLLATIVPRAADDQAPPASERPTLLAFCTFAMLMAFALLSVPWLDSINPLMAGGVRASHRVEDDLATIASDLRQRDEAAGAGATVGGGSGRIFARLEWGEYLGWALAPQYKVFIDGRIEIFPDNVWAQYCAVTSARADWQQILDAYGVDYLVLDESYHFDLLPQVRQSPRWHEAHRAGSAVLFERSENRRRAADDPG